MPDPCESLWLRPARGRTRKIPLACFKDYPYFFESFKQYNIKLPAVLEVNWRPIKQYLMIFDDEQEEDPEWIREVSSMIKKGEPVPPLLLEKTGDLFDGRHRAWAAHHIGIKNVPVVTLPF
jgi:hypothetical protein